jgi:hypothetical protein
VHPKPTSWRIEQRQAATDALLRISRNCDGAEKRDGHGFNSQHANSNKVSWLIGLAHSGGPLPAHAMGAALAVLKVYRGTQLSDLAPILWPARDVAVPDVASACIGVLKRDLVVGHGKKSIGWAVPDGIFIVPAQALRQLRQALLADGADLTASAPVISFALVAAGYVEADPASVTDPRTGRSATVWRFSPSCFPHLARHPRVQGLAR